MVTKMVNEYCVPFVRFRPCFRQLAPLKLYYQILVSSTSAEQPAPVHSPQGNSSNVISPVSFATQANHSPGPAVSSRHLSTVRTGSSGSKFTKLSTIYEDYDGEDDYDREPEINTYSISTDKPTKPTKVTLVKNYAKAVNGSPTTAAHTNHHYHETSSSSKSSTTPSSAAAKSKYSSATPGSTPATPKSSHKLSDFKSLRSNDIKYSPPSSTTTAKTTKTSMSTDVCTAAAADVPHQPSDKYANKPTQAAQVKRTMVSSSSRSPSASPTPAATDVGNRCDIDDIFTTMKRQHEQEMREAQQEKRQRSLALNNTPAAKVRPPVSTFTPPPSPSIVVSIPTNLHRGRRNSINEEHYESMSLAKLKTANKKSDKTAPYKHSVNVDDIVLRQLTNGSIPTYSATPTECHGEAIPKLKIELTRTNVPELETDAATSAELRAAHKKRKKLLKQAALGGKVSKRPKLHAEISSQADESLKFKLKITANKKPSSSSSGSKHERKVSSTSNESSSSSVIGSSKPLAVVVETSIVPESPRPMQGEDTLTGAVLSKLVIDELKKLEDEVSQESSIEMSELVVVDETSAISVDKSDAPDSEQSESNDVEYETTYVVDEMSNIVRAAGGELDLREDYDDVIITDISYLPLTPPETNNNDNSLESAPIETTQSVQLVKPKPVPELRPKSSVSPMQFLPAMRFSMVHQNNNNEQERLPIEIHSITTPTDRHSELLLSAASSNNNNPSEAKHEQPNGSNVEQKSKRPADVSSGSSSDNTNSDDNSHAPKRKYSIEYRTINFEQFPPLPKRVPNLIRKRPPRKRINRSRSSIPMPMPMPMEPSQPQPSTSQLSDNQTITLPNRPAVEIVRIPNGSNTIDITQATQPFRSHPMPGKFKPNNLASNVFHMSTQLPPNTAVPSLVRSSRPMPPTISLSKIRSMQRRASPTPSTSASSSSSSSTLMMPPLVKTSNKRSDHSGALDLSGGLLSIRSIHSAKGRNAAHLQPPVAYIDITSPTKADKDETVRPAPTMLTPESPPYHPFVLNLNPTFSYAPVPIDTAISTNDTATLSPITSGMSIAHILNAQAASKSSVLEELTRRLDEQQRLANLKLLSESADGREKLDTTSSASTTSSAATTSSMPALTRPAALYLTPKPTPTSSASITATTAAARTATNMRQQNASVRNIPNPSALAFRGYEPLTPPPRPSPASSSPSAASSSFNAFNGTPPPQPPTQMMAFSIVPAPPAINHSIQMLTTTLSPATPSTASSSTNAAAGWLAKPSAIPPMPPLIPTAAAVAQFDAARSAAVSAQHQTAPLPAFNVATSYSSTGGAVQLTVHNSNGDSATFETTATVPWLAAVHSTVTTSSTSQAPAACVTMASSSPATPAPSKNQQPYGGCSSSSGTSTHLANAVTTSPMLDSSSSRSTPLSA